jgi:transposase
MEEFLRLLDESLRLLSFEYKSDVLIIQCETKRAERVCPYCGIVSDKVHSRYVRKIKDLPFGGVKVILMVSANKYFCQSVECGRKTFSERLLFLQPFSRITKRLNNFVLENAINTNAMSAEKFIRKNTAQLSDTTINRIIKKNLQNNR